eukprot:TRINITY_DN91313_c0_g1_i1.p1 TRINITY_DN91313_c0_g1~~TRINITY_DN91313_c0_g1_i1.p1  ORF type:complete len:428 (-),score=41.98 TRINITY_DN91313_c0_g1_i1:154-1437(-)
MWKPSYVVPAVVVLGVLALFVFNFPLLRWYWLADSNVEHRIDVRESLKTAEESSRMLYGVELAEGFSFPLSCPWIGQGYVCSGEPKYVQWLEKWAAKNQSTLNPATDALPRGNSLWVGTSHSYQTATALICQHNWELQAIEVMRCDKMAGDVKIRNVGQCPTKVDAYKNELCESCIDDLHTYCQMVAIEPNTRCENRAYPNVWGQGGTRADSHTARNMFKMPSSTREDRLCGIDRNSYPTCSFNVARFTFRNGHIATVIHNHVLQFYNNSLQTFAEFLNMDMAAIDTIVYASPWELQTGKDNWKGEKYHLKPDDPKFFENKFREDILDYAVRIGNFGGNLVFVSWHTSDKFARDLLALPAMLAMAENASLDTASVLSKDVAAKHLGDEWCATPGDNCGMLYAIAGSHQCIPGVPDVVAWDVQRLLRR